MQMEFQHMQRLQGVLQMCFASHFKSTSYNDVIIIANKFFLVIVHNNNYYCTLNLHGVSPQI